MSRTKAVIGFNHLTEQQLKQLVKADELVVIADRGECWTPRNCRQRLSFAIKKSNRDVDPYFYDKEVECALREFRASSNCNVLYDVFRRVASRSFLNYGLMPSPLEVDFARSYLEWWICKNIILNNVDEVYFAYHPHSPFDLCVYHLCRAFRCNVYSIKNFYSNPFYILSKNILDGNNPDLLLSAIRTPKGSVADSSKAYIRGHLEHAKKLLIREEKWGYVESVESRWHTASINAAIGRSARTVIKRCIEYFGQREVKTTNTFSIHHGALTALLINKLSNYVKKLSQEAYGSKESAPMSNYVLFSMQIQPEATTEIFGGIYLDQLALLRELRTLIPDEIPILVRDHKLFRCSEAFGRPSDWSEVVEKLPNTYFVDPDQPNSRLIKNALLVCSASGTCCLEANVMGIASIYGGRSEYILSPMAKHIREFTGESSFQEWFQSVFPHLGIKYEEYVEAVVQKLYPFVRYGSPYKDPVAFFNLDKVKHDNLFLDSMVDL